MGGAEHPREANFLASSTFVPLGCQLPSQLTFSDRNVSVPSALIAGLQLSELIYGFLVSHDPDRKSQSQTLPRLWLVLVR